MRRRLIGLLVTLALGLLCTPLATEAQPSAKIPRIGFLRPSLLSPCRIEACAPGRRARGDVEGPNIVIEWRGADGTLARPRALAVERVQLPVDVCGAASPDGPLAAMQATRPIPLVLVAGPDPVAMGLVTSLAPPGGNVTGGSHQVGRASPATRRGGGGLASGRPPAERGGGRSRRAGRRRRGDDARGGRGARAV
jgi:putative ABC transport system substrate-binding protein